MMANKSPPTPHPVGSTKPKTALRITKQQLISIRNGNYNSKKDGELMLKSLASPEDKEANKKYVKKLS